MAVMLPGEIQSTGAAIAKRDKKDGERVQTANALAFRALDGDGKAYRQLRCLSGDNAPELVKEFGGSCGFATNNAKQYAKALVAWLSTMLNTPSYAPSTPDKIDPVVPVTVEPPPILPPPGTTQTAPAVQTTTTAVPSGDVTAGSTPGQGFTAPASTGAASGGLNQQTMLLLGGAALVALLLRRK